MKWNENLNFDVKFINSGFENFMKWISFFIKVLDQETEPCTSKSVSMVLNNLQKPILMP